MDQKSVGGDFKDAGETNSSLGLKGGKGVKKKVIQFLSKS